jgi:cyclopropane fatty-acyl-phospholipid synthase-like methyltransferase
MGGTERFDQAAATWDQTGHRVQLARAVAAAIAARVALSPALDVLDFGCGTGLVTLALAPGVGTISGADSSPGMLGTLAEKARAQGSPVHLVQLDCEGAGDLGGPYHLIVSSMTLHHIADVPALFRRFAQHLQAEGQVALADLDSEDGSFHEDSAGVHHQGFAREQVRVWLEAAGFQDVLLETATEVRKAERTYPVFLATARRA